jgi:membrane fusion protein, multidrug efflux system
MLMQNDQEADQQLLEEPRGKEEVKAWAPTSPDHPAREWNGPTPPLEGRNKPRRGFVRRHPVAVALGVPLLLLVGAGGYLYWDYASHFETTDDAFIAARQFAIAPKVPGYITTVPVTDNEHVAAGQVIARIDDRDYRNALAEGRAQVAAARATVQNIDAQITVQRAQVAQNAAQVQQAQASLTFAQQQEVRYSTLARDGWGTVQNSQQWASQERQDEAGLKSAQNALVATVRQLAAIRAQRETAEAKLQDAAAQRDQAALNLSYTVVTAAQPGRIVNLTAGVGEYAQAGTNLTMFVPDDIWVTANFKETQLDLMRPGQKATIEIDAYPARRVEGHIASVQPGSGPAFSLLPPENATGNYVKIVQRVPVKIVIDNPPTDVALGPGMSVEPKVRVDPKPSLLERLEARL